MSAPTAADTEQQFPDYYLEHRALCLESGIERIGDLPIWLLRNLDGWSVNAIVIEGDDGDDSLQGGYETFHDSVRYRRGGGPAGGCAAPQ